jgi:hypothetical protein
MNLLAHVSVCGILLAISGCAALSRPATYDSDAKETMVRVIDKREAATDVR